LKTQRTLKKLLNKLWGKRERRGRKEEEKEEEEARKFKLPGFKVTKLQDDRGNVT